MRLDKIFGSLEYSITKQIVFFWHEGKLFGKSGGFHTCYRMAPNRLEHVFLVYGSINGFVDFLLEPLPAIFCFKNSSLEVELNISRLLLNQKHKGWCLAPFFERLCGQGNNQKHRVRAAPKQ
jgi:hypothetical protein